MFARIAMLVFVLTLACGDLWSQQDPLIGTWKLNLSKSKYEPGPPPQSQVNKYEPSGKDGVKRTIDGVNARGEKNHTEESYLFDGKEHPVNNPAADAGVNRRLDAYTTERMLAKGPTTGADALLLDLEDAVPAAAKDEARAIVRDHVPRMGGVPVLVRVNAASTGLTRADLEAVVVPGLAGVFLPKVGSPAEVREVAGWLDELEGSAGLGHRPFQFGQEFPGGNRAALREFLVVGKQHAIFLQLGATT